MPNPEATKQSIMLDLWALRRRTGIVLLISFLVFLAYSGILIVLYPVSGGLGGALVLIVFEAAVGLTTTRKYSSLGAETRARIHFLDPSTLGSNWKKSVAKAHREEISRLFERAHAGITDRKEGKTDDLNDIAWFGVLVYSVFSVGLVLATGPNLMLIIGAPVILLILCVVCYENGYGNFRPRFLDEDLDEIEHHVLVRLSALEAAAAKGLSCVRWLDKGRTRVVSDIGFSVELRETMIYYWVGIPSQDHERFEVIGRSELPPKLLARLGSLPVVTQLGWEITTPPQQEDFATYVSNPIKMIRISSEYSVVVGLAPTSSPPDLLSRTILMLVDICAA
jgi:hypothetical protein